MANPKIAYMSFSALGMIANMVYILRKVESQMWHLSLGQGICLMRRLVAIQYLAATEEACEQDLPTAPRAHPTMMALQNSIQHSVSDHHCIRYRPH